MTRGWPKGLKDMKEGRKEISVMSHISLEEALREANIFLNFKSHRKVEIEKDDKVLMITMSVFEKTKSSRVKVLRNGNKT